MDYIWVNLKNVRLDYKALFGKGARAPTFGEEWHERAAEIEPKKRRPTFFQIDSMSVCKCIKTSLTQLENHSQLLCGHDIANERLLVCQIDV